MFRGRRLRMNPIIRSLVRENRLQAADFIYPVFVVEGKGIKEEIASMPGQYHYSVDCLDPLLDEMKNLGIRACLLFGIPDHKDACGSEAYNENGIIQRAIRYIRSYDPQMYIIADVCMCEYTDHGHCGILDSHGMVKNDETVSYLQRIALSYARAGADMVAPSDMMDGRIGAIRSALDENGFEYVPLMAYSAKYASNFYGPFREAAHSAPGFGDRKSYQMDPANSKEAMREIAADLQEGADAIIIKPALPYLDIMKEASRRFDVPLCAYNVSGEYAMLVAAVQNGWMKPDVIEESLLCMKRAGANMIITYFALYMAKRLKDEKQ
ncbi:MAG TPA: porphobilinogen synthase [Erysipelotrichaceae bacterium]|nr:porphobilinogen synthase [Erysipelotrichaceae bacterium]